MATQAADQFTFGFLPQLPVVVQRHRGQISSDAGLLPIREFDDRWGYTRRMGECLAGLAPDSDGEAADELGCWGWLRGVRDRAQMIELRRKDGHIMAVGYGWLDRAEYEPSEGITLYVTGREIKITGRNLDAEVRPNLRLFTAICRHRCLWLREADQEEAMSAGPKATVIESIEW